MKKSSAKQNVFHQQGDYLNTYFQQQLTLELTEAIYNFFL